MSHSNINVDLIEGNLIEIIRGVTINVDVNVKNVIYVKKIMFAILLHLVVRMENIWQVLWITKQLCVIKL